MALVLRAGGVSVALPMGKPINLTNMLTNSNFASTTGWNASGGTFSAAGNEALYTAAGQYGSISQTVTITNTRKYYFASSMYSPSNLPYIMLSDNVSYGEKVYPTGAGGYERLSALFTSIRTTSGAGFSAIVDGRTSGFTQLKGKYSMLIDLTAAFGAGNEPTKAQMDNLLLQFANSWFNGTTTAYYSW